MTQDPPDEDFELHLVRDSIADDVPDVPDSIRAMRARRVRVDMPTGTPSVQEVLHNPTAHRPHPGGRGLRRLMRAQLRLAVTLMSWFFGIVVVFNIALHVSPAVARISVGAVPIEWFFPVVIMIPLLLFLGWWYIRRATVLEQRSQRDVQQAVPHDG